MSGSSPAANPRFAGNKQHFSSAAWQARLDAATVSKRTMDELVMNYLVIEGYKEAAEAFRDEASVAPGVDLDSITDRVAARNALQEGDVVGAVAIANELNPLICDENEALFFHLKQQKLIELIRAGDVDAALAFAETDLAPLGQENREFLAELERTMTLLAFEEPAAAPMGELLGPAQRQKTAGELNAAILSSQCQDKDPKLPGLLKLLAWAQGQLKDTVVFPVMDVHTGELQEIPEQGGAGVQGT
jgi:glucose-induced degradation protein 8